MFVKTENSSAQGLSKMTEIHRYILWAALFSLLPGSAECAGRDAAQFFKHCTKMPFTGEPAIIGNCFQRQRGVYQQVPCPFQPDIDEKLFYSGFTAVFKDMPQIMLTDSDSGGNILSSPDSTEFVINYPAGAAGISIRKTLRFRGIITLPGKFKQSQQQSGSPMVKHRFLQIIHSRAGFSQKSQISVNAFVFQFLKIMHGAQIAWELSLHPDMNTDIFALGMHGLGMSLARRMNHPAAWNKINSLPGAGANFSAPGLMIYNLKAGVAMKRASSRTERIYPSGNESVPQTAGGIERFFSDVFNNHILESYILKSRGINLNNNRFMEYIAVIWNCKTTLKD